MRLIDADAITKRMIAFCDKNCPYTPKERDVMCGACFMGAAMELLEDASTIEPERKPERLTDDDFETIRIHLNAYKEKLCNQQRWEEAEEYQRIIDRFMAFASAQPEIEKRKEESAQNVPKEDLISRKAAIEALDSINCCGYVEEPWDIVRGIIERVPAAQPDLSEYSDKLWKAAYERGKAEAQAERKTGRWIDKSGGMASSWNYCSVCGNQQIYRYDFCPNCGADMRGDTDEVD